MKKKRTILKLLSIIIVIALSATGMFVYQEDRYGKIIDIKDQIAFDLKTELTELQNIPKRSLIVLNKEKAQGQEIKEEDLMTLLIEESASPENAMTDKSAIIGKRLKIKSYMYQYLTDSLIYIDRDIPDDLREKEYTYLSIPEKLEAGDTVDLRIKFPSGQDYIVLSKKLITDIERTYNDTNELIKEIIWLNQGEDETVRMGSAVVDAYLNGAKLYLIEYVDPYIQEAAIVNYPKNFPVLDLISSDPNLVDFAEKELENRQKLEQSISDMNEDTKIEFTTPTIEIEEPTVEVNETINDVPEETQPEEEDTGGSFN